MSRRRRPDEEETQGASMDERQGASPDMAGDTTTSQPDRERIARRAYEKYLARGGEEGRADEDWFSAEQELSTGSRLQDES